MSRHSVLTAALWALVIAAVIPVAIVGFMFFPVLVLFGADPPQTTRLGYLFTIAQPLLAMLAVAGVGGLALWMWGRWKVPAFALALGMCGFVWSLGVWLLHKW